ncbi:hypothetical protein [Acidianus sp. HS-5]|uniref:hypothetical protein n=1 Tax=Acidianus sp. HS-5 TaxID=2886040 RepID=UPI001F29712D|nr:hypothetical protein [Acidianus sp. HS-5]BDC18910.1 hypothetical protein HS5_18000 [Acidianus sp. HS-5]
MNENWIPIMLIDAIASPLSLSNLLLRREISNYTLKKLNVKKIPTYAKGIYSFKFTSEFNYVKHTR